MNPLTLAYLGDAIYELYVRKFLISKGFVYVKDLQEEAIKYVSAKAQAKYLNDCLDRNIFTEEEISVMKRARNYKNTHHPKNCDVITYKYATAFEAIIGYLDLMGKKDRIEKLIAFILEDKLC